MKLGANISALRTARGLSQAELAERLGVSRQSVSKWETDVSVPDLERLVQLSELFGVPLDQLVKGEPSAPEPPPEPPRSPQEGPPTEQNSRGIRITVLFCTGLVVTAVMGLVWGSVFIGLLFGGPLLAGALFVRLCPQHPVLWTLWVGGFCLELFGSFSGLARWTDVLRTFHYSADDNYIHLVLAWVLVVLRLLLAEETIRRTGREGEPPARKTLVLLAAVPAALLLLPNPYLLYQHWTDPSFAADLGIRALWLLRSWLRLFAASVLLTALNRRRMPL